MAILSRSLIVALAGFVSTSVAADIYVSTNGTEAGTGTIDSPLNDIQAAVDVATAGTTIYLRGGTYTPTTNIQIDKSGTAAAPYVLTAYASEKVILDGEDLTGLDQFHCFGHLPGDTDYFWWTMC